MGIAQPHIDNVKSLAQPHVDAASARVQPVVNSLSAHASDVKARADQHVQPAHDSTIQRGNVAVDEAKAKVDQNQPPFNVDPQAAHEAKNEVSHVQEHINVQENASTVL